MARFKRGSRQNRTLYDHGFTTSFASVTETIDNTCVASQSLTGETLVTSDIQSGNSTQALYVEATADTDDSSASGTQAITDIASTESPTNSGTGSSTLSEQIAETTSNSATATILVSDFQTEQETNSGTGSPTIAEATAEIVDNQGGAAGGSGSYGEGEYGEGEYGSGSGGENQTILEAIAETVSNSATATISIGEVTPEGGDELTSTGTATLRINEAEVGSETGSGSGSPSLAEVIAETVSNSATATILVSDFQTEEEANTGTGSPTITEAVAEGVNNSATSSQNFDEQSPEFNLTSVATSNQTLAEAIAETLTNSASSSQTFAEASTDTVDSSATNTPSLIDYELDNPTNTGTGSHFTDGEKIAEMDTVAMLASLTMDEQRNITVVPFADVSTGTWTVVPLYEKVDELVVASGYPTETIRSGNNPSNDTAELLLAPVSDPGVDDNHYINVEFYKDGDETLDFTINFKEGSTLIATRTFTDVQETESAPRRERIALTNLEASGIVDYSNLRTEVIANQTS